MFFSPFPAITKIKLENHEGGDDYGQFHVSFNVNCHFSVGNFDRIQCGIYFRPLCPFTPVFAWLILRDKISKMNWLSVGIALFGMALLVFSPERICKYLCRNKLGGYSAFIRVDFFRDPNCHDGKVR